MLTRRNALAGVAGLAGLSLTRALPISVTAAPPAQSPLTRGPLPPRTHNDIIAAFLEADEPGPEWPLEVHLLWQFVRCPPDELDWIEAVFLPLLARSGPAWEIRGDTLYLPRRRQPDPVWEQKVNSIRPLIAMAKGKAPGRGLPEGPVPNRASSPTSGSVRTL